VFARGLTQKASFFAAIVVFSQNSHFTNAALPRDEGGIGCTCPPVSFTHATAFHSPGTLHIITNNAGGADERCSGLEITVPGTSELKEFTGRKRGGRNAASSVGDGALFDVTLWPNDWLSSVGGSMTSKGDFNLDRVNPMNSFLGDGLGANAISNHQQGQAESGASSRHVVNCGLRFLSTANFETSFLSRPSADESVYSFGFRNRTIPTAVLADLAVTKSTTNPVPIPGAVVLGAFGLAIAILIGWKQAAHRKNNPTSQPVRFSENH